MSRRVWVLLLITFLSGCAYYSTTSRGRSLQGTVSISFFANRTSQPDLGLTVTEAIVEEVEADGSLEIVNAEKADFLLEGAVSSYSEAPFSFGETGQAEEYRLSLSVKASFFDRSKGEALWRNKTFSARENFYLEGSSAGEDLTREAAEEKAIEKIIEDIMNAIFGEW